MVLAEARPHVHGDAHARPDRDRRDSRPRETAALRLRRRARAGTSSAARRRRSRPPAASLAVPARRSRSARAPAPARGRPSVDSSGSPRTGGARRPTPRRRSSAPGTAGPVPRPRTARPPLRSCTVAARHRRQHRRAGAPSGSRRSRAAAPQVSPARPVSAASASRPRDLGQEDRRRSRAIRPSRATPAKTGHGQRVAQGERRPSRAVVGPRPCLPSSPDRWSRCGSRPRTACSLEGELRLPDVPEPRRLGGDLPSAPAARRQQGPPDPVGDPQRARAPRVRGARVQLPRHDGLRWHLRRRATTRSGTCAPPSSVSREEAPGGPGVVCGWSFGANVALREALDDDRGWRRSRSSASHCGRATSSCPRSPVATDCVGSARRYCSWPVSTTSSARPGDLRTLATEFRRASVEILDGTDHYLWRREREAAALIGGFVDRALTEAPG